MSPPLYIYGVVAAGSLAPLELEGVCGAPVFPIEEDGLAALAGELPEPEPRLRRRDLQAHLDVLRAAFERTTVVPCSFGTAFGSEDEVRGELLRARRDELTELLERLDGRSQFELSVTYDDDVVLREVVAADPEIARLREQTRDGGEETYFARVRLGELVAGAVEARREADAAALLEAVGPHVEALEVQDGRQDRVLKASLLVANDRVAAFERTLEQLAAEGGGRMRLELVGPLPPTAFVQLEDAEAATWG
jgi:gas vesicle protein GvpL/GvpF